jgi:copper chaperone NosL
MDINEKEEAALAGIYVANYAVPGEMINAKEALYLISPEIKSPMGANLSAVDTQERASKLQDEHTGELYSWVSLKEKFADR